MAQGERSWLRGRTNHGTRSNPGKNGAKFFTIEPSEKKAQRTKEAEEEEEARRAAEEDLVDAKSAAKAESDAVIHPSPEATEIDFQTIYGKLCVGFLELWQPLNGELRQLQVYSKCKFIQILPNTL